MKHTNTLYGVMTLICLLCQFPATANIPVKDSLPAGLHVNLIERFLTNAEYLRFDVSCITRQNGFANDTLTGEYRISQNRHYVRMDSTLNIQDGGVNLTVYPEDRIMMVQRITRTYTRVMQIDLLDTLVRNGYVTGTSVTDTAGYQKLTVSFNEMAPYVHYAIVYSMADRVPISVTYSLRGPIVGGVRADKEIKLVYSNFSFDPFSDNIFSTAPYFTRTASGLQLTPAYTAYSLIDHTVTR